MNLSRTHKQTILKLISAALCVALPLTELGPAISTASAIPEPNALTAKIGRQHTDFMEIPESLAETRAEHLTLPHNGGPVLFLIKDAHNQYYAQQNIEKTLHFLYTNYQLKTVFLEGGLPNKISSDPLRFFDDENLNINIAERLMREGEIGGAELFLLKAGRNVSAYGAENPILYRDNLRAFQHVYAGRSLASLFLRRASRKLNTHISRFRHPVLQKLLKQWLLFERNQNYMEMYLGTIKDLAAEFLNLDLDNVANQDAYPQLVRYFKLKSMKKDAFTDGDRKVFELEQTAFLKWLAGNAMPPQISSRFRSLFENISEGNTAFDLREFLELFYELAHQKRFDFSLYPKITAWLGGLVIRQEIKALDFSKEVQTLTRLLFARLAQTQDEKNLLGLCEDFKLLEDLLALRLTNQDWERVKNRLPDLAPSSFQQRIGTGQTSAHAKTRLEVLFDEAARFYNLAERRDKIIFKNVFAGLKQTEAQRAALVAGGFHADRLGTFFEQNGVTVFEVTPKMAAVGPETNYLRQMLLGASVHTMLKPVSPGIVPLPVMHRLLGEDVFDFHRNRLLGAIAAELRSSRFLPAAGPGLEEQGIALNEMRVAGFGARPSDAEQQIDGAVRASPTRKWFHPKIILAKTFARLVYIAFLNFIAIPITLALPILILEKPLGWIPADTKSRIIISLIAIPAQKLLSLTLKKPTSKLRGLFSSWAAKTFPTFAPKAKFPIKLRNTFLPLSLFLILEVTQVRAPVWLSAPVWPYLVSVLLLISVFPLVYLDKQVEHWIPSVRLFKKPWLNLPWQILEKFPFLWLHFEWVKFYYTPWFFLIWPWAVELEGNRTLTVHGIKHSTLAETALKSTAEGLPFHENQADLFFYPWYPYGRDSGGFHALGRYTPWLGQTIFMDYFSIPAGKPDPFNIPHETGHQKYFASWFQNWRALWDEAYNEYKKATHGFIITSYSLQNELEGFAEWFGYFYRNAGYRLTADFLNRSDAAQKKMWLAVARAFVESHGGAPYLRINFLETETHFLIPVTLDPNGGITLDELIKAIKEAQGRQMDFISRNVKLPQDLRSLEEAFASANSGANPQIFAHLLSWAKLVGRPALAQIEPDETALTQMLSEIILGQPDSDAAVLAVQLLGKIGSDEAVDTFGKILVRERVENGVKRFLDRRATLILKEIGTPAANQALSSSLADLLRKRARGNYSQDLDESIVFVIVTRYDLTEEDWNLLREIQTKYKGDTIYRNNIVGWTLDQYMKEVELRREERANPGSGFGIAISSESILAVARSVAGGILRHNEARGISSAAGEGAQSIAALAPKAQRATNDLLLLSNPAAAENLPLRISVNFSGVPRLEDPRLLILLNFLARNQLAQVRIEVPDVPNFRWLETEIRKAVIELRKKLGVENRNIALRLENSPLPLKRFVGDRFVKTLVYDARREVLETLRGAEHVFLVENDIRHGAPLDLEALALLNTLDQMLTQAAPPRGIQKALDLLRLSQNLRVRAQAQALISQAA